MQGEFTTKENVVKWYGCKWDHMNCIYGLLLEKYFLEYIFLNLQKKFNYFLIHYYAKVYVNILNIYNFQKN